MDLPPSLHFSKKAFSVNQIVCHAYFTEDDTHFTAGRKINMQNIWHTPDRSISMLQLLDLTLLIRNNESICLMTALH